ncbi:unnamed protein product [Toxocara canis]|uniref:J domain-containing protein n=1 Tax=Toxocara canis TaxID=6265 RepID=A0A183U4J2_TOXCA|nr:unnamed protein product [Toxocara canis]
MRTCYDILGCTPSASTSELKSAYFQSLRANHPDKGGLDASAISLIANAWKILREASSRRSYDIWLREQQLRAKKGSIGNRIVINENTESVEESCRQNFCGGEYILDRSDLDRIVESALFECSSCSLCLEVSRQSDVFPSSTVGCAVSVIAHQYRAGSAEEETELIELWDIGGSTMHQKASTVFLEGAVGAILVHDVSNSKSEASLAQWVSLLRGDNAGTLTSVPSISNLRPLLADIESTPIPTLVVGCKLDLAPERAKQVFVAIVLKGITHL